MVVLVKKEESSTGGGGSEPVPSSSASIAGQDVSGGDLAGPSGITTTTTTMTTSRQSRKDTYETAKAKSLSLKSQLKSPFKFLGKTTCGGCKKKCSGEVLRVGEKYFHSNCFKCTECQSSISSGGFFTRESKYFCTKCYQINFGTKCAKCNDYVEGEVVSALGNTFHQRCFTCGSCGRPFPTGERVTFTGKSCLCQRCIQTDKDAGIDHRLLTQTNGATTTPMATTAPSNGTMNGGGQNGRLSAPSVEAINSSDHCAGCGQELKEGQALVALEKQYHIWCFKCTACGILLHGEYMGHEGRPYCERDYHDNYGVRCAYCQRFISGKVLQAGDNNHFHPTCARCSKCGDPFGDGEEMYLQGTAIWHPRCGPGPGESGFVLNGGLMGGGGDNTSMAEEGFDGLSSTMSELHYGSGSGGAGVGVAGLMYGSSRASSPGGSLLRDYRSQSPGIPFAFSYLREGRSVSSLRRPIDPYDRKTSHPPMHFHVPQDKNRKISVAPQGRSSSRSGMRTLVDNLQATSPRPRSPHMNNEEPIEMSHYPDGRKTSDRPDGGKNHVAPIERDDFPAPPFLYADPERRRRWSEPMRTEDEANGGIEPPADAVEMEAKLKTQEETLRKISTGPAPSSMGKVFYDTVKQREKINAQRRAFIDPRSYARTPSASREPPHRLRYESPVNASPSRLTPSIPPASASSGRYSVIDQHYDPPPTAFYRSSSGRSLGSTPAHSHSSSNYWMMSHSTPSQNSYRIVPSGGGPPKPGYTGGSHHQRRYTTLPATTSGTGLTATPGFSAFEAGLRYPSESNNNPYLSPDFDSRSDISEKSYEMATDGGGSSGGGGGGRLVSSHHRRDLKSSTTYTQGLRHISTVEPSGRSYSAHMNRSLPNMAGPLPKAPKIYPIHLLLVSNYRLPNDVDRCNLERHLSDADFELVFEMARAEFYRLPQWRRNDLKKRVKLF